MSSAQDWISFQVSQWDAAYCYDVRGCGLVDCDGQYRQSSTRAWCLGAPVYEGKAGWLLHRGFTSVKDDQAGDYGWVIAKDGCLPAYGSQSAEAVAPLSGWRALRGRQPAPETVTSTSWEDHLLSVCGLLKDKGNFSMGQSRHSEGETRYSEGIACLEPYDELLEASEMLQKLLLALHANRAEARLRLRWWEKALEDCDWILWWDDGHPKAIVRAAKAYRALARWDESVGPLRWLLTDGGHEGNKDAQELLDQAEAIARCKAGKSPMSRTFQDVQTLRLRFEVVQKVQEAGQQNEFELVRAARALCRSLARNERRFAADRGLREESALVLQGAALVGLAVDILLHVQAIGWSVELLGASISLHTSEEELRYVLEVLQSEAAQLAASPDELLTVLGRLGEHRLSETLEVMDHIVEAKGLLFRCLGRWTRHLEGVDADAPACTAAQVLVQLDSHCTKRENIDAVTGLLFHECFVGQDGSELHVPLILRSGGAARQLVWSLLQKWTDSKDILRLLDVKMVGLIWSSLAEKLRRECHLETQKVVEPLQASKQELKRLEWFELSKVLKPITENRSLQVEELLSAVFDFLIAHLMVRCEEKIQASPPQSASGPRQLVKEWVEEVLDRRFAWGVLLPLIMAPPQIARRVLLLLALLSRNLEDDAQLAKRLAGLHAFMPFLTLAWPQADPAGSHLGETLALGPEVRFCAALILRCVAKTEMCQTVVRDNARTCCDAVLNLLQGIVDDHRLDSITAVVDAFCTMAVNWHFVWSDIPDEVIRNVLECFVTSTDDGMRLQLARVLRHMYEAGMERRLQQSLIKGLPHLGFDADQAELTILEILDMEERLDGQQVAVDEPAAGLGAATDEEEVCSGRFDAVVDAIFAAYLDPGEKKWPRVLVIGRMARPVCWRIGEIGRSCRVVLADVSLDHVKQHRMAKCIDPVMLPKVEDLERSTKLASFELFDLVIVAEPIGYFKLGEYVGKLRQFIKRRVKMSEKVKDQVQLVSIEKEEHSNKAQYEIGAAGFNVAYHDQSFKELWNLAWKLQYILCVFSLPSEEEK